MCNLVLCLPSISECVILFSKNVIHLLIVVLDMLIKLIKNTPFVMELGVFDARYNFSSVACITIYVRVCCLCVYVCVLCIHVSIIMQYTCAHNLMHAIYHVYMCW